MSSGREDEIDEVTEDAPDVEEEETDADDATEAAWAELDAAYDREEEGPFDIDEVDLEADADEVQRLDLGRLVITPFPDMQMQLQVDQAKEKVQAFLAADGESALEVALFAGPTRTSMLNEIRHEVLAATEQQKGEAEVAGGPFGAEIRRRLPVTDPEGNPAMHVSRMWLADGPGWVLRGVLMGRAALEPDNEEAGLTLLEFFANLVVRRGTEPAGPGSLLTLTLPELDQ